MTRKKWTAPKDLPIIETLDVELEFFALRYPDGSYWVGSGGYYSRGDHSADIASARTWRRSGPARSAATRYAKYHRDKPPLQLVRIVANRAYILEEQSRVEEAIHSQKERAAAAQLTEANRAAQQAQARVAYARSQLEQIRAAGPK